MFDLSNLSIIDYRCDVDLQGIVCRVTGASSAILLLRHMGRRAVDSRCRDGG